MTESTSDGSASGESRLLNSLAFQVRHTASTVSLANLSASASTFMLFCSSPRPVTNSPMQQMQPQALRMAQVIQTVFISESMGLLEQKNALRFYTEGNFRVREREFFALGRRDTKSYARALRRRATRPMRPRPRAAMLAGSGVAVICD